MTRPPRHQDTKKTIHFCESCPLRCLCLWVRERLKKERELILTKDGKPFGLLIGIGEDDVEESLKEVRRAMFSKAVAAARKKAAVCQVSNAEIGEVIAESRKSRGLKQESF